MKSIFQWVAGGKPDRVKERKHNYDNKRRSRIPPPLLRPISQQRLALDSEPTPVPHGPTLILGSVDWVAFQWELDSKIDITIPLKTQNEIDEAADNLTKLVQNAVWNNTHNSKYKLNPESPYLPVNIKALNQERRLAPFLRLPSFLIHSPPWRNPYNQNSNWTSGTFLTIASF